MHPQPRLRDIVLGRFPASVSIRLSIPRLLVEYVRIYPCLFSRVSVPQRGRKRAAALGSEGVRAIERAAGVETGGDSFVSRPPRRPVSRYAERTTLLCNALPGSGSKATFQAPLSLLSQTSLVDSSRRSRIRQRDRPQPRWPCCY